MGIEQALARSESWLAVPCRRRWLSWGALPLAVVAVIVRLGGPTMADAPPLQLAVRAMRTLDLAHVYRPLPGYLGDRVAFTSPPGFPLLVTPLAIMGRALGWPVSWIVALATISLLVVAAVWTRRAMGGAPGDRAEVLLAALVALSPFVIASVCELFHPQDLAATAFVLAGFATAGTLNDTAPARWRSFALAMGAAVACRQWALVALPFGVMVLPPGRRLRAAVAALAPVVMLSLPFLLLDRRAAITGLFPKRVLWSHLAIQWWVAWRNPYGGFIARTLPLAAGAVLAAFVARRLGSRRLPASAAVAATAGLLAVRLLGETTVYQYYVAPVAVLLLVAEASERRLPVYAIAYSAVTAVFVVGPGDGLIAPFRDMVVVNIAAAAVAVAGARAALVAASGVGVGLLPAAEVEVAQEGQADRRSASTLLQRSGSLRYGA